MSSASSASQRFLLKTLQPQAYVAIRAVATPDDLSGLLNDLLTEVWAHLNQQEHVTVGPAIVRYHGYAQASGPDEAGRLIDIEAGFPVAEDVPDGARARRTLLPGGRAATTLHWGPYAELPRSWAMLEDWIAARGLQPAGPRWEIYWVDPTQAQDDSELRTELVCPIESHPA